MADQTAMERYEDWLDGVHEAGRMDDSLVEDAYRNGIRLALEAAKEIGVLTDPYRLPEAHSDHYYINGERVYVIRPDALEKG